MTDYILPPPAQAAIRMANSSLLFPVHRIYCVGRNFAEHAKEMSAEPHNGTPVFFMKPADAVIQSDQVPYPSATQDLHHEVELVVALGPNIPAVISTENADQAIFAYGVGLDLTRRDLQAVAKEKRLPWDTSKGFDASAPMSDLCLKEAANITADTILRLTVNGVVRQQSTLSAMLFSVTEIIVELSKLYRLQTGDLIFMGTPAGVAAMQPGDYFSAELVNVVSFEGKIA